ncbi:WD40-repeat-containing domain protein [Radiomyces spectabilis]|uniref:WD40-repeat-containing domain protein n=1 Tax=Radiomyces spectabilis TaxID=64574 RepID=UPI00221EA477|nr:WD40-repeat-containing domain protein [Radiomyces spectabilis]KAI8371324.1 WD40-repeat-containing domain protein [Radiomyces spectabilis]
MPIGEIPGFYYDEEKNKYFKIMPTGPYSLAAIKKARESKAAVRQDIVSTSQSSKLPKKRSCAYDLNLALFCRQRETQIRQLPLRSIGQGSKTLYRQLKPNTEVQIRSLSDANMECRSSCLDATSYPDHGEVIVSVSGNVVGHYGFQTDPFFHMWKLQSWEMSSLVTSLKFSQTFELYGNQRRTLISTTLGNSSNVPAQLSRHSYPIPQSLSNEEAEELAEQLDDDHPATVKHLTAAFFRRQSYMPDLQLDCLFHSDRDSFWTSSSSIENNIIIAGGDKGVYHLTSQFDNITQIKVRSSVLATHIVKSQPSCVWLGSRNGNIHQFDVRYARALRKPLFQQSSSVTNVVSLDHFSSGHRILAASMDGSLNIWDVRNGKTPIRELRGHINHYCQELAFDLDVSSNIVTVAGSDHRLRLWSLCDDENSVLPFWESPSSMKDGPVSAAKFITSSPSAQPVWSNGPFNACCYRRSPGLMVCAPDRYNHPAIHWMSPSFEDSSHRT